MGLLSILSLLGAICLFLYGMKVMSEGLQKAAGDRLRGILSAMTRNHFTGFITGLFITALIQSSSASTVMLVSFVNAGLMSLGQAIAVIFGANVGSTFTALIIAFFGFKVDIGLFVLPLIAVAVPMIFSKKSRRKSIGEFLIGFSLLFMGLDLINDNFVLDENTVSFLQGYANMGVGSMLIFFTFGLVLTMVIQSSAASFAIALVMCTKGWIPYDLACAVVLGSNMGTTITPVLASLSGNVAAKRAAGSHVLYNIVNLIWAMAIFYPFVHFNSWLTDFFGLGNPTEAAEKLIVAKGNIAGAALASLQFTISMGMTMYHIVYNIISLLLNIWFVDLYAKVVTRIFPSKKKKEEEEFQLKYISAGVINASELNIAQAEKEMYVFAQRVERMIYMAQELIHTKPKTEDFAKLQSRIGKYEDISDRMEIEIANFLNRIAEGRLSNDGKKRIAALLRIDSEIESIADSCFSVGKEIVRKHEGDAHFDQTIYDNIDAMFVLVKDAMKNMLVLLSDFEHIDEDDIIASYNKEREINNFRNQLRTQNFTNINNQLYLYQAGIFYMDVIGDLEKTGDYIINVVDALKDRYLQPKVAK
ncbi:MAG: Na/Pi cotransporter family protein [Muribaculaceae bacterium]|nr:Na/Pi cotransporter family protein [Muribaculaceae bacterium]